MKLFGSGQNALVMRQRRIRRYFDPFSGPFQSMVQRGSVRFFTFRIEEGQESLDASTRSAMQTAMLFAGIQPDVAITQLKSLAEAFPDNPSILGHLGQALCAAHRMEEALDVLSRAHSLAPRDAGILAAIAQAERIRDDLAEALKYPDVLIPKRDVYARDLLQRAMILRESDPTEARRYAQAIADHTTDLDLKSRANVFLHLFEWTGDGESKSSDDSSSDAGSEKSGTARANRLLSLMVALQGVRSKLPQPETEKSGSPSEPTDRSSQGDLAEAIGKQLGTLANADPVSHLLQRGVRCNQAGQYRDAADAYRTALSYDGEQADALNNLAWLYATCPDQQLRSGNEALRLAAKACRQNEWSNATTLDTLAAAFAESGAFEQAVKYQERAIASLSSTDEERRQRYRRSLDRYRRGEPTREPCETT